MIKGREKELIILDKLSHNINLLYILRVLLKHINTLIEESSNLCL